MLRNFRNNKGTIFSISIILTIFGCGYSNSTLNKANSTKNVSSSEVVNILNTISSHIKPHNAEAVIDDKASQEITRLLPNTLRITPKILDEACETLNAQGKDDDPVTMTSFIILLSSIIDEKTLTLDQRKKLDLCYVFEFMDTEDRNLYKGPLWLWTMHGHVRTLNVRSVRFPFGAVRTSLSRYWLDVKQAGILSLVKVGT